MSDDLPPESEYEDLVDAVLEAVEGEVDHVILTVLACAFVTASIRFGLLQGDALKIFDGAWAELAALPARKKQ